MNLSETEDIYEVGGKKACARSSRCWTSKRWSDAYSITDVHGQFSGRIVRRNRTLGSRTVGSIQEARQVIQYRRTLQRHALNKEK